MGTVPNPLFLQGAAGQIFVCWFESSAGGDRSVLFVPPFAEEANKCRRMVALACRALQSRGLGALAIDLYGTGDSAGDFVEAQLETWTGDLQAAVAWLSGRGTRVLDVVAVRSGALLLAGLPGLDGIERGRLVLWQPVLSGRQFMGQLLRLRRAGEIVGTVTEMDHDDAQFLEIAGYEMSWRLVQRMEQTALDVNVLRAWQHVAWFEVGATAGESLSPAAARAADAAVSAGARVERAVVEGDPFWATPEIATNATLIARTCDFLTGSGR